MVLESAEEPRIAMDFLQQVAAKRVYKGVDPTPARLLYLHSPEQTTANTQEHTLVENSHSRRYQPQDERGFPRARWSLEWIAGMLKVALRAASCLGKLISRPALGFSRCVG